MQFGVTSVTACPPDTAADPPSTSYNFPLLSSVVEPYENDRPVLVDWLQCIRQSDEGRMT